MSHSGSKTLLHILNAIIATLTLALAVAAIWFFVQVTELTNLRNSNHYLLDYNVYWPQAIPWLFTIVCVMVLTVTCCGFSGAKKDKRGLLMVYVICMSIGVIFLIAIAIMALVFVHVKSTNDFVKDTIWDVFSRLREDDTISVAFGNIEKKLHCCGADSPRDYKGWKTDFPQSCCDTYYHGWLSPYAIDCDYSNKLANERHGCIQVANQYAKIAVMIFSSAAILIAILSIFALLIALSLSRAIRRSRRVLAAKMESESGKVLI